MHWRIGLSAAIGVQNLKPGGRYAAATTNPDPKFFCANYATFATRNKRTAKQRRNSFIRAPRLDLVGALRLHFHKKSHAHKLRSQYSISIMKENVF